MDQIHHFLHSHPLMLTEGKEVNDGVDCSGCKQVLAGPIYGCSDCSFYLHKSCVELPEEIQNFFHPCPLVLRIIGRHICNACFEEGSGFSYRCRKCKFNMHVKCALRPTIKSEGEDLIQHFTHWHPLTLVDQKKDLEVRCNICGKLCTCSSNSSVYGCEECHFFLHNSCMINIPQQVNHFFHPESPLILFTTKYFQCTSCGEDGSDLVFRCGRCPIQLDVKCALLPTVESKGADKIQHYAHHHPLAVRERMEFGSEVRCRACGENCLGPCFVCERCDFFLHKQCSAELPREIHHHFHPVHPFILSSLPPVPYYDTFQCCDCGGRDDRFLLVYCCAKCDFIMHTACAKAKLTGFLLKYEGHPHCLTFFDKTRGPFPCRICHQDCQNCFFRCVACKFDIHLYCFPSAPKTIKHKCHSHPLTLTTSPFEFEFTSPQYRDISDADEFFCDVCEEKRCGSESVYYCGECKFIAEIRCVIYELLPSLTISEESSMNGRVISRDEENSAIEATIAKLRNEIAKLRAKEKPLEVEIEKLQDTLMTIKSNREQLETDYNMHIYQLNHNKASTSERLPPYLS